MKIRYIGTSNYQEYPVTGTNALWQPQWVSDVSDYRATALVALGTFVYEDDSTYANQLKDRAAELDALGIKRGIFDTTGFKLTDPEVLDFASASFVHVGGSGSSIDTSARNSYGGYTATLNIGSTLNDYARIRTYALPGSPTDMDLDGSPFIVVLERVSGMTNSDTVSLSFSSNPATDSLSFTWGFRPTYRVGNLYYYVIGAPNMSATGGLVWSTALTYMQVQIDNKASSGGGGVVKLHGVFRRGRARPKAIIEFDDNDLTVYTQAFPYMSRYGLVGNIAVIKDRVGTAGYCTEAQLDEMYAAGWDFTTHGDTPHNSLSTFEAIRADISSNKNRVASRWPRAADHYVYPAGIIAANSQAALVANGMKSARVTVYTSGAQVTAPWGVDDKYALIGRGINDSNKAVLLTDADMAIDACATVRYFGHIIKKTVTVPSTEIAIADFRTFIDGIATRVAAGKIDVVTMSQWASKIPEIA